MDKLDYINKAYDLNVSIGDRVRFEGKQLGTVKGERRGHIKIKMDNDNNCGYYHPTWRLEFLANEITSSELPADLNQGG